MTADLLMICPTRGRPRNAIALWEAWQATSTGAADLCFAVDDDDPELESYRTAVKDMTDVWLLTGPRLRMVGTLNMAADIARHRYRYLGFLGDDHRPRTVGFDARFVECLSAGTGIVYGNDLLQHEAMPTAVAMTSNIVTALGYIAPPSMLHLCVDLVWKDWGEAIGRLTYLDDVILEHLHPANGKAAMDAGYEDANSSDRVRDDSAAYYEYLGGQFHEDVTKLKALL